MFCVPIVCKQDIAIQKAQTPLFHNPNSFFLSISNCYRDPVQLKTIRFLIATPMF